MEHQTGSCTVAGAICLDIIPEIQGQPDFLHAIQPGQLLAIGQATLATGGSVSNTGLALYKLGIKTRLMGKVGDDPFGEQVLSLIRAIDENLVSEMQALANEDTSYTIILSPADVDRVFLHCPGANDTFGPEDIDYEALHRTDLFHFGYPTAMARMFANDGEELIELLQLAKDTGITTSLDTSMFDPYGPASQTNWEVLLRRVMPFVDIFMPSLDEVRLMLMPGKKSGNPDAALNQELAERLLDYGAAIVVLKEGKNGLYMRTTDLAGGRDLGRAFVAARGNWRYRELWAPAFKVSMVGTTGAGDCAVAGFLAAVSHGMEPENALGLSAAVGACNVEAADATSGVRSLPDTLSRIESGWEQHNLALPGWKYDPNSHLWFSSNDGRALG
jgi:sugar/nucleoside kinase (ribokinase family)